MIEFLLDCCILRYYYQFTTSLKASYLSLERDTKNYYSTIQGMLLQMISRDRIELPICIYNVESVTDCWIYNRLSIIKTSPYYEDWISSHYNLYSTQVLNFHFGNIAMYSPAYHEEILQRTQIRLFELTCQNLIDNLKEYLKSGFYIIMFIKSGPSPDDIHEILIYGFDDIQRHILCVAPKSRIFTKTTYSYSYLQDTLKDVKQYFLNHEQLSMDFSLNYQYPITALKLNPSFKPDNCVFEAYRKIQAELRGEFFDLNKEFHFGKYTKQAHIYTGIGCLDAFQKAIENEIAGREFSENFRGLTSAAKKLQEHRLMMLHSISYVLKHWKSAFQNNSTEIINQYNTCYLTVEKWSKLCLKYEFTRNINILVNIYQEIPDVFNKEKKYLEQFINNSIDWQKFNKTQI